MKLLGAIYGDIIGSCYEFNPCKDITKLELFKKGSNFTDDTVLTVAVADALINNCSIKDKLSEYGNKYKTPVGGYGGSFLNWLSLPSEEQKPYNSWGNGSPMRCSACGWLYDTLDETLEKAKESAEPTHNHIEGIKGAQVIAGSIYLLRNGRSKEEVKEWINKNFDYDFNISLEEMRKTSKFEISCQKTIPQVLVSFFESSSLEECALNAVSLGADSDTVAAIACSLAEAFYGLTDEIQSKVLSYLPKEMIEVIEQFNNVLNEKG